MYYKLTKKSDFEKVAKLGQPFFSQELGFKLAKNSLKYNRYGVVVNLKVDKRAVARNKIRRRIREIIKLNNPNLKQGFDVMILTRELVKELNYQKIKEKLFGLFIKADLCLKKQF